MLDKKFFAKIRSILLNYAQKRREIIKIAGDAQQLSKKSIFAVQRNDFDLAKKLIHQSLLLLKKIQPLIKTDKRLENEGSYKASLEEFVEATIFFQCIDNKAIANIKEIEIDADIFISGICDVPGELYRYAIKSATDKNFKMVTTCHQVCEEIILELVDMDLTGYNRQKFDQAKQALHKLEQVIYEVSLKRL
jgi:predicted translin family RNA/ssDNA-binding protein